MANRSNSSTANRCRDFLQLVMANCMRTLLFLILAIPTVALPDQLLFNVDCGTTGTAKGYLGLTWIGDEQYVPSGQSARIRIDDSHIAPPLTTLRYFPSGIKNCYSFPGVGRGNKILIRASFFYGNYDGLSWPPIFNVFVNENPWGLVNLANRINGFQLLEAMFITKADGVSVCLGRINDTDIPFISAFEIRKLEQSMYSSMDIDRPLHVVSRFAYGSTDRIRYPDDRYDRIWSNFTGYGNFPLRPPTWMSDPMINLAPDRPPLAAMRQAITASSPNLTLPPLTLLTMPTFHYVTFYFAEVSANATRSFDLLLNNDKFYNQTVNVPKGSVWEISYPNVILSFSSTFKLVKAKGSALPPLISASECFVVGRPWFNVTTEASDVKALSELQKNYVQLRGWNGDPCLPIGYNWLWLDCSFEQPTPRVAALYLSSYGLTGPLADFSELTALQMIDLHNNSLNGSIPEFLGKLPQLKRLNLADNRFTGSLPASLRTSSLIENLNISGNNITSANPSDLTSSAGKKANVGAAAGGIVGSTLFLLLLVVLVIFIFKKRPGNAVRLNSSAKPTSVLLEPEIKHGFSYSEIVEITSNFEKILGEGGSGNVYYGRLRNDTEVAVKVLKDSLLRGTKEFVAEARLLMTVHHRCLVSFVGYCEEGGKLILLYEYMGGGNLRQLLSGRSSTSAFLTWETRLKIALRVATGLDYLHSGCYPPIIHRDVKTTNILLNAKMEAKVADFGLSKASQKDDGTHLPTLVANKPQYSYDQRDDVTQLSTAVAGTPGYIDPEYYLTNLVTKRSDVYSFGVVLLELITGHPSIFAESEERLHIVEWVTRKITRGEIHSIADPKLSGQYDVNSMWKVVDIAVSCTSETSDRRPHMIDVVNELKEALEAETYYQQRTGSTPSADEVPHSPSFHEFSSSSLPSSHLPSAR